MFSFDESYLLQGLLRVQRFYPAQGPYHLQQLRIVGRICFNIFTLITICFLGTFLNLFYF